jgi:hypothetical protein
MVGSIAKTKVFWILQPIPETEEPILAYPKSPHIDRRPYIEQSTNDDVAISIHVHGSMTIVDYAIENNLSSIWEATDTVGSQILQVLVLQECQ